MFPRVRDSVGGGKGGLAMKRQGRDPGGDGSVCSLTVSTSTPWLGYCTPVLYDVTVITRKGIHGLCLYSSSH